MVAVPQTVDFSTPVAFVDHFRTHGWVMTPLLDGAGVRTLRLWVDEISSWPDTGEWMHHREATNTGPALCRSENVVPHHAGVRSLLCEGTVAEMADAILGEPAVLYKDKVNYKPSGGGGYAPHQDAPAYPFIDSHVSAMIAVDDSTLDNGCLEVASGRHQAVLATDAGGRIRPDVVDRLEWTAVPLRAGWILWFDSLTPHRSGPNRTEGDRRALYPTFNARSEGDLRQAYYRQKREAFAAGGRRDGMTRVSLIDDFMGRAVT